VPEKEDGDGTCSLFKHEGRKGSKYDLIIDKFSKSDMTSVRVESKNIDPKMLAIGLRNRIKTRQIKKIKVSQRGDNVCLTKE